MVMERNPTNQKEGYHQVCHVHVTSLPVTLPIEDIEPIEAKYDIDQVDSQQDRD